MILSVDMAHAIHPNYAAMHEKGHAPHMNAGIVIKVTSDENLHPSASFHFARSCCCCYRSSLSLLMLLLSVLVLVLMVMLVLVLVVAMPSSTLWLLLLRLIDTDAFAY